MRAPVGLLLKRLALVFGSLYLGMVSLTNLVNFVATVTGRHWAFLNSENHDYIASVVAGYGWPSWFDTLAVLGAASIEGIGALLFVRALVRFRGGGSGLRESYQALAWNVAVWTAFIAGTEFFVAYPAEGTFRDLLGIGLLLCLVITLVPDDVPSERSTHISARP